VSCFGCLRVRELCKVTFRHRQKNGQRHCPFEVASQLRVAKCGIRCLGSRTGLGWLVALT
jgi:hypothetical protein